jgi:hypothetical protein
MTSPITKTCNRCGDTFKVAADVDFAFSHLCDNCIRRSQPYPTLSPTDRRIDAQEDWKRADEEHQMIHGGRV